MNHVAVAKQYARDVVSGEVPAGKYVRQACQRFLDDLDKDWRYYLDEETGERWCKFLERLPHVKGKWASTGQTLTLSPWQVFCIVNLYGWKDKKTHLRRFREAYIEVPRKNGKTFLLSGLGLGHLVLDGEFGAEVYCGATSEKQAMEVFRPAKQICERTPALRKRFGLEVNSKVLNVLQNGSRFEPVIGNPGDGASPSCGIADEFHEHPNSDQVDTFVTGMGARDQPMMLYITTAGSDMGGPCYAKRDDCISILKGASEDERVFAIIYTIDDDDDWDTIEAQKKANPNYGVSVNPEFLEGQLLAARRSPISQTAYKTKHLNLWVGAKAAWMNMLAYQACRNRQLKLEDFEGRRCFMALDLASKIDISSLAILFPPENGGKWGAFVKHYLPEERINESTRYQGFHAAGHLTATPGNVTDFAYIREDMLDMKSKFQIEEVPFDPFQATQFSTEMYNDYGFPMIEYGATVKNFSEPMKQLEALILEKKIEFDFDPVLLWMFGNVVAKLDLKDNIFPNKERPENKIDGVVALIMALGRALFYEDTSPSQLFVEIA